MVHTTPRTYDVRLACRNDTSMVTILHGVQECKDVYEAMEKQQQPEVIEGYDTEVNLVWD